MKTEQPINNAISDRRIAGVKLRPLETFINYKGNAVPVFSCKDPVFIKCGRMYLSTRLPGVFKGRHYHSIQTEYFTVVKGTVDMALYDVRQDSPTNGIVNAFTLTDEAPTLVEIPPHVVHSLKTVNNEASLSIVCASEPYNSDAPDKIWFGKDTPSVPYSWEKPVAKKKNPSMDT